MSQLWKQPDGLCSQKYPQGKVLPKCAPTEHHFYPARWGGRTQISSSPPCSKPVLVLPCRFAYKDEYEKFKLYLTIILLIVSFSCRFLLNSR